MIHITMTAAAWGCLGLWLGLCIVGAWPFVVALFRAVRVEHGYRPLYTEHPTIPHVYMPATQGSILAALARARGTTWQLDDILNTLADVDELPETGEVPRG